MMPSTSNAPARGNGGSGCISPMSPTTSAPEPFSTWRPASAGLLQDFPGEMQGKVVLAKDGKHIDALFIGRAEHLDDLAFRVGMAGFPAAQLNHDFIADIGRAADIARWWDVDILRHPGVIGDDVEELPAFLEGADQLGATAFEDANDGAGAFLRLASAQPFGADI